PARPPPPTLFPSTTLFRSGDGSRHRPPLSLGPRDSSGLRKGPCAACPPPLTRTYLFFVVEILHDVGVVHLPRRVEHVADDGDARSEEHTSELQSRGHLVCR